MTEIMEAEAFVQTGSLQDWLEDTSNNVYIVQGRFVLRREYEVIIPYAPTSILLAASMCLQRRDTVRNEFNCGPR